MSPNYKNACIYHIRTRCIDKKVLYIGSTTHLTKRKTDHKSQCNNPKKRSYNYPIYNYIRSIGGWETIIIEKLYDYPCNTKDELFKEENRKINEIGLDKLFNDMRPIKSNNRPKSIMTESNRVYRREIIQCECGFQYTRDHHSRHLKTKRHQSYIGEADV